MGGPLRLVDVAQFTSGCTKYNRPPINSNCIILFSIWHYNGKGLKYARLNGTRHTALAYLPYDIEKSAQCRYRRAVGI